MYLFGSPRGFVRGGDTSVGQLFIKLSLDMAQGQKYGVPNENRTI